MLQIIFVCFYLPNFVDFAYPVGRERSSQKNVGQVVILQLTAKCSLFAPFEQYI